MINGFGVLFGIVLGISSIYYTWKSNRVRGPEFVIPEAFLESKLSREDARGKIECRIMTLIQNIGDRVGYLRLKKVLLNVTTKNQILKGSYHRYAETRKKLLAGESIKEKSVEFVLKAGEKDVNFQKKAFDFILTEEASEDWLEAKLILEGEHSTHNGAMAFYKKEIPINLKPT